MKKLLSLVLSLMLLCGACATAETFTEKEIKFAEFTFGMTFEELRAMEWVESMEFSRNPKPTRLVGDAMSEVYAIVSEELSVGAHFTARLPERDVAGHRAQVHTYFVYPSGASSDNQAVLYAGTYSFFENGRSTFEDLRSKLTKLYGTPWMETTSAEDIWGPMPWSDHENDQWRRNEWTQMQERYQPIEYLVWKSSVNGGVLVLKTMRMYGDMEVAEVDYLWPEGDQHFEAMMQNPDNDSASSDMQGL